MKRPKWIRLLLMACTAIITLCTLTQGVFAVGTPGQSAYAPPAVQPDGGLLPDSTEPTQPAETQPAETEPVETQPAETQPATEPEAVPEETEPTEENDNLLLEILEKLPEAIANMMIEKVEASAVQLSGKIMDGWLEWGYASVLTNAEWIFSLFNFASTSIFTYSWFQVIVGLFRLFGWVLFAVGMVLAVVDVAIEYRRRGADLTGAMLNLGKGMFAVGLFSTLPVPLFNFCVNIQHVILRTLAIDWSFQNIIDAVNAQVGAALWTLIMLIVILVLWLKVGFESLKRGGVLLVQICIGSLHMLSVPRGYMDNFYGWCKQVIALCITVLLQNLLLFCGLMLIPVNLLLGIGTMCAAKEVPRICAQFGLDTSAKANFTHMAMGANAAMQAVKAGVALLA